MPGFEKCLSSKWRRRFRDCRITAPQMGHDAGCSDWDLDFGSKKKREYDEFIYLFIYSAKKNFKWRSINYFLKTLKMKFMLTVWISWCFWFFCFWLCGIVSIFI